MKTRINEFDQKSGFRVFKSTFLQSIVRNTHGSNVTQTNQFVSPPFMQSHIICTFIQAMASHRMDMDIIQASHTHEAMVDCMVVTTRLLTL